jgi:AraC family transcriptional regulator
MQNNTPQVLELEDKKVACVSFVGNYMGNPKIFKELFGKLHAWAGPKGLITANAMFLSSYQDDPNVTPVDQLKLDVCMTIEDNVEVEGEIKKKTLPGGQYAVMRSTLTSPKEYGAAWKEIVNWISTNNYEIDMSRPSYELYLNNPEEHPEKHHILDICMSIKAK